MSASDIQPTAEEVRRFFQYQALFCEQLSARTVTAVEIPPELQDSVRLSSYVQSRTVACTALAGLSFIWETLDNPRYPFGGSDTERFICFLLSLKVNKDLARVSTPFLYYALDKRSTAKPDGVERYFRTELFKKWVEREDEYAQHLVIRDPEQQELRDLYDECERKYPALPDTEKLKNVDHTLFAFTYAGLVYKLYRNAFAHEYHSSQHTAAIGKPGEGMRVLQYGGVQVITPVSSSEYITTTRQFIDKETGKAVIIPLLDVPITVLTDAIREGADLSYDLIVRERYLPYGYDKRIELKTRVI
jgi:hypothetical protein